MRHSWRLFIAAFRGRRRRRRQSRKGRGDKPKLFGPTPGFIARFSCIKHCLVVCDKKVFFINLWNDIDRYHLFKGKSILFFYYFCFFSNMKLCVLCKGSKFTPRPQKNRPPLSSYPSRPPPPYYNAIVFRLANSRNFPPHCTNGGG